MHETLPSGRNVYLRVDRLEEELSKVVPGGHFGRTAQEKARAAYLGLPYFTYWRLVLQDRDKKNHGEKPERQVSAQVMRAIWRAFPDKANDPDYFFEERDSAYRVPVAA